MPTEIICAVLYASYSNFCRVGGKCLNFEICDWHCHLRYSYGRHLKFKGWLMQKVEFCLVKYLGSGNQDKTSVLIERNW